MTDTIVQSISSIESFRICYKSLAPIKLTTTFESKSIDIAFPPVKQYFFLIFAVHIVRSHLRSQEEEEEKGDISGPFPSLLPSTFELETPS